MSRQANLAIVRVPALPIVYVDHVKGPGIIGGTGVQIGLKQLPYHAPFSGTDSGGALETQSGVRFVRHKQSIVGRVASILLDHVLIVVTLVSDAPQRIVPVHHDSTTTTTTIDIATTTHVRSRQL